MIAGLCLQHETITQIKHQGGFAEDWDWKGDEGDASASTNDPDIHQYSSGFPFFLCLFGASVSVLKLIIQTIHRHLDVKHNTHYGLQTFQLTNMDQFLLSLAPNVDLKMCGSNQFFPVWRRCQIPARAQLSSSQSSEAGGRTLRFAGFLLFLNISHLLWVKQKARWLHCLFVT